MIPLYGFVQGDTLGLLLLADEEETVRTLASRLQAAASVRVAPRARVRVLHEGREAELDATLATLGVHALDRFDLLDAEAT
jgi:hypothetical protein